MEVKKDRDSVEEKEKEKEKEKGRKIQNQIISNISKVIISIIKMMESQVKLEHNSNHLEASFSFFFFCSNCSNFFFSFLFSSFDKQGK